MKQGGMQSKSCEKAEKVVVAVKASREIPKTALVWALTHVVQPGDCITLLVVVSSRTSGKKFFMILFFIRCSFLTVFSCLLRLCITIDLCLFFELGFEVKSLCFLSAMCVHSDFLNFEFASFNVCV